MISVKSKYALTAMLHMALHTSRSKWRIKDLSAACEIPQKYLESILNALRQGGVLKSDRGMYGGYYLAKKPNQLTVFDVVNILEQDYKFATSTQCRYKENVFWARVDRAVQQELETSIETLVQASRQQIMYTI